MRVLVETSISSSLLVVEKHPLKVMNIAKVINPPELVPLANGYTYCDFHTLKTDGSVVELSLRGIRWRRCFYVGILLTLSYAATVALSCLTNPAADIHPFVYILGGLIAISPFVFPFAQQRLLSHQRPSVRLRLDHKVANLIGMERSYPFHAIAAFADCTWVDHEGSVYGELQVLARENDEYRWLLVAQCMGPADDSLSYFAGELARLVGAEHVTVDKRGSRSR